MSNDKKPSILLIMADQLRFDALGFMDCSGAKTPNIDRLASMGVMFENAYSNCPICAPARASLVTGRLVRNTKVYDNGAELSSAIPTFMHGLKSADYDTVLSGKMHFIGSDQLHGFDRRLTTDIYPSDFGWTPDWEKGTYANPGTSIRRITDCGPRPWNFQMDYDEETCFRALEYLRERCETDKPFFLCASFTHPHCPYFIPEEYWDMYADVDIPMPRVRKEALDKMHPFNLWLQIHHECDVIHLSDEQIINARRAYLGMVTYFDEQVGKLIKEAERLGMTDNLLIVLTSDHGDMMGERGMWFKRTWFDGSSKIPLIARMDGAIPAGSRIKEAVSLIDLAPTLLEIADANPEYAENMDGTSIYSLMKGEESNPRDEAVMEYYCEGVLSSMLAVRSGKWKYVYVHKHDGLLYDMESDPDELTDLSADRPDVCKKLKDRLLSGLDVDKMETEVIKSQKERLLICKVTRGLSWDYQPFFDASKSYVR